MIVCEPSKVVAEFVWALPATSQGGERGYGNGRRAPHLPLHHGFTSGPKSLTALKVVVPPPCFPEASSKCVAARSTTANQGLPCRPLWRSPDDGVFAANGKARLSPLKDFAQPDS